VAEYLDAFSRALLALVGMLVAGHHLAAAAAINRAPHVVKLFSLPLTVGACVGVVFFAVTTGAEAALMMSAPALLGVTVTEFMAWRAGSYLSSAFEMQAAVQDKAREDLNRVISEAVAAADQRREAEHEHH
jgi:hypothetical protein